MGTTFKETKIERIPEGWELLPFDGCIDKKRSKGKYQKLQTKDYLDKGQYPIVDQGQKFIAGYTNDANDLYTGSLPVTIFGDHTLCVKFVNIEFAVGADGTVPLYPNKNKLTDRFFYYLISNHEIQSEGYQRHFKYLKQKRFPLPPLPEQRKITEILSTVDEAIEKTDAIIRETQQLKKGLMQKLLTEGIGHTRFKETAIGRIPEEWEITQLGDLGEFFKGKTITQSDIIATGLPCIRYGDIYVQYENDHIVTDFSAYISRETAKNGRRIYSGDILFAGTGETVEDIGKCVAYTRDDEAYAGGDLIVFRPEGKNQLNSIFLSYCLNNGEVAKWKSRLGQGLSIFHIYARNLKTLIVPVPSVNEQHKIAEIFCEVDAKIKTGQAFKSELEHLKKGLMQVLLTGKVRVKV